jgi:hypothetical protein
MKSFQNTSQNKRNFFFNLQISKYHLCHLDGPGTPGMGMVTLRSVEQPLGGGQQAAGGAARRRRGGGGGGRGVCVIAREVVFPGSVGANIGCGTVSDTHTAGLRLCAITHPHPGPGPDTEYPHRLVAVYTVSMLRICTQLSFITACTVPVVIPHIFIQLRVRTR